MKAITAAVVLGVLVIMALLYQNIQNANRQASPEVQGIQNAITNTPFITETPESQTTSSAMTSEITVRAGEFSFTPSSITVSEGQTVTINLVNNGEYPHDLVIDELGVRSDVIAPGETTSIQFTSDRSGTFKMYCSVGNHREQGMEGEVRIQ